MFKLNWAESDSLQYTRVNNCEYNSVRPRKNTHTWALMQDEGTAWINKY